MDFYSFSRYIGLKRNTKKKSQKLRAAHLSDLLSSQKHFLKLRSCFLTFMNNILKILCLTIRAFRGNEYKVASLKAYLYDVDVEAQDLQMTLMYPHRIG